MVRVREIYVVEQELLRQVLPSSGSLSAKIYYGVSSVSSIVSSILFLDFLEKSYDSPTLKV